MRYAVVIGDEYTSRVVGPFESEESAEAFVQTGFIVQNGQKMINSSVNPHHWRADGRVFELEDPATADDGGHYERIQELIRKEQREKDLASLFNDG